MRRSRAYRKFRSRSGYRLGGHYGGDLGSFSSVDQVVGYRHIERMGAVGRWIVEEQINIDRAARN